ncbi:MAG: HEAT repeat domain-containing protein [Phormidesmis sp.]
MSSFLSEPIYVGDASSPASPAAQAQVDQLVDYVNEQIELLAFDEPDSFLLRQMVQCLVDPRRATRLSLVDALSQIGEPATPFLLEGLEHHDQPVVRRACCNALTNIGDPAAVSALIEALTHDADISVKSAAAGALATVGVPAFDSLRDVLADTEVSESSKGHAAWAIASMSSEVGEKLYRNMSHPAASVRTAVIGAIAQLAQKQMAHLCEQTAKEPLSKQPPKQPQTGQPSPKARPENVKKALSIMTEALSDHSPEVRIEAAANLARLKCQTAYQPLVACLKDSDAEVRKAAAMALAKLGNPAAIEAIALLERDAEASVRRIATLMIAQLKALRDTAGDKSGAEASSKK